MPRRSLADQHTDKTWPNRAIEGIGVETLSRLALGTLDLGFFHRWRDRPDNTLGYLILQIEDVAETTIKPFCPKMCARGGIDELSCDAHPVGRFANAPFQYIAHPQLTPDLLHVDGAPLVCEARVAGDDEQRLEMRQGCNDVIHHSVREIFLFRIGAQVGEGENGDRGFVGERKGGVINTQAGRHSWHGATVWDAPDPHRFGDILQGLRTQILKRYIYLATNLPTSVIRDADAARLCDPFETHCNIDPITKDIIVCDDNITDVNADAKFDPLVLRHIGILFRHAALDFVGASDGIDHACELDESAVPGVLDDASAMISDFGIKKRLSKSFQLRQRAFFVDPYQAARACDIRRQNSRLSPLYVLAAQDAPPKSLGKLNWLYSSIVGRCPAMPMSEMGQDSE
jgi:hypothetical protein